MIVLAVILIIVLVLYILSTMCKAGRKKMRRFRRYAYAHRGLHSAGVPENSMAAFEQAMKAGYGVELDVHLLADGNLAVIHDAQLKRTTGEEGLIGNLTADDLSRYKLEGTAQTIPLFSDVLALFAGKVPIILELKCDGNNFSALCEKACDLMDTYNGLWCMESFDPRCIRWLRQNRPDVIRGQLTENYFKSSAAKIPVFLKFLLKAQMMNFLTLPDFVAYRFSDRKNFSNLLTEKLWGAQSVAWTLKNEQEHKLAIQEGRIVIFEGYLP